MTKLALDLDDETLAGLKRIAEREGRSLEDVAHDGVSQFVANENEAPIEFTQEQIAQIEEGLEQLKRGEGVTHDEAMRQVRARDA